MAATIAIYNYYKKFLLDGTDIDLDNDTIKVALCTSDYTPDIDNHDYFDDITDELSGGGYTAGGKTLSNVSLSIDTANDKVKFDADDVTWTDLTATNVRYAIIYKDTGTASTSPLIAYVDFGEDKTFSNADLKITWSANGIFTVE